MTISKPERHANEVAVFLHRGDAGAQALRTWMYARRDELNEQWMDMVGEDLTRAQGEAKVVKRVIRLIDQGPTIKGEA